jgi:predicted ester cyclase
VLGAFPDARYTVEDQLAEGEKVLTRWSCIGTHKGELMGIAPTGKLVRISGMLTDRIVDSKIVEEWSEWDALGMMQQMGVVATFPKVMRKVAA